MQFNAPTAVEQKFYTVFDIEFLADQELYERYRRIDPRPAVCRWPMRRVVAVTALSMSVTDGIVEIQDFRSFSGPDEKSIARALFSYFEERPFHRAVTWGGLNMDLPILTCAAMDHNLKLPRQLRHGERERGAFLHLDLAKEMKAGSGDYVHLLEVAMRIGAPAKFGPSATAIQELVSTGQFKKLGWICESDVVTTAWILCSHLATRGEIFSAEAAHYAILRHVRLLRGQASYNAYLGNVLARLRGQMESSLSRWMAEAA